MTSQEQILSILTDPPAGGPAPTPVDGTETALAGPPPAMANRPKILMIDDDRYLRTFVRVALERAGYAVSEAADGREGLKLYETVQPACVITDMKMPVKDGLEIIMEIRRQKHPARILAISGGFDGYTPVCLRTARLLGADATLHKPFTTVDLLVVVARLVPPNLGTTTA